MSLTARKKLLDHANTVNSYPEPRPVTESQLDKLLGKDARPPCGVGGLTEAEHRAVQLLAEFWDVYLQEIIAAPLYMDRDYDIAETAAQVHALQHRILAQSAARAYPNLYRLQGNIPVPGDVVNTHTSSASATING